MFWGVFHGMFLIIERLGFSKILSKMIAPASALVFAFGCDDRLGVL
jgi:hypothetical protein